MNFKIFSTNNFENYRYELSKIKNQGKMSNIDKELLSKGEKAIDYNKKITRSYYFLEFLFLLKRYKHLNNLKYVWMLLRIFGFSLLINAVTNNYMNKHISEYLMKNMMEKNNLNDFQSFINHRIN